MLDLCIKKLHEYNIYIVKSSISKLGNIKPGISFATGFHFPFIDILMEYYFLGFFFFLLSEMCSQLSAGREPPYGLTEMKPSSTSSLLPSLPLQPPLCTILSDSLVPLLFLSGLLCFFLFREEIRNQATQTNYHLGIYHHMM